MWNRTDRNQNVILPQDNFSLLRRTAENSGLNRIGEKEKLPINWIELSAAFYCAATFTELWRFRAKGLSDADVYSLLASSGVGERSVVTTITR